MAENAASNTGREPWAHLPAAEVPGELQERAREFFRKGAEVAYTLNYDYAIELYLDGLSFWPDAVEEGHHPLREIAFRRQAAGGKKSGMTDSSRFRKLGGKTPKEAMLKAEYLWGKDPSNPSHIMDMAKAAVEGGYLRSAYWMCDVLFDMNRQKDKPVFGAYVFLKDLYTRLEAYSRALQACQMAAQLKPKDSSLQEALRDLAAQATMQQGKYDTDGDFRDSIKDRETQDKLHDQELLIRAAKGIDEEIAEAKKEYEANPEIPGKISKLVELLIKTEQEDREDEAVELLEKAFKRMGQFGFKQRAGQIRIKQLRRQSRMLGQVLATEPENEDLQSQVKELEGQLRRAELEHYAACVTNYPTDMGLRFEYAKRLAAAGKYDEAIPLFQQARNDPKHRVAALNGIGQCFFSKEWYTDAVETFQQALGQLPSSEDAAAKELRYNLGRAYEGAGEAEEALKCFRKIAQIDFNYRDVRERVDKLRSDMKESQE